MVYRVRENSASVGNLCSSAFTFRQLPGESVKSLQVLLLIPWLICYLIFIFLLREFTIWRARIFHLHSDGYVLAISSLLSLVFFLMILISEGSLEFLFFAFLFYFHLYFRWCSVGYCSAIFIFI